MPERNSSIDFGVFRMIKKVVTVIITLALIAALTGCNSVPDASESTSLIETSETTTEPRREIVFDGSEGFSLETNGDAFTNEELETLARKRYLSYGGEVPDKVKVFKEIGDTVYIGFYYEGTGGSDNDYWLFDFYRVDRKTGVGFDRNDFNIDLTAYV